LDEQKTDRTAAQQYEWNAFRKTWGMELNEMFMSPDHVFAAFKPSENTLDYLVVAREWFICDWKFFEETPSRFFSGKHKKRIENILRFWEPEIFRYKGRITVYHMPKFPLVVRYTSGKFPIDNLIVLVAPMVT